MRLFGVAGGRRSAKESEIASYQARVKRFRSLKGYALIWKDLSHVRDIKIEHCEPIVYPTMTDGTWKR